MHTSLDPVTQILPHLHRSTDTTFLAHSCTGPAHFRQHLHCTPRNRLSHVAYTSTTSKFRNPPHRARQRGFQFFPNTRSIHLYLSWTAARTQYASYNKKLSQTTGMSDCNLLTLLVLTGRVRKAN